MKNWSYDIAVGLLEKGLETWGFQSTKYDLMRMGSNAIFSLKNEPYVIRVSKKDPDFKILYKRYKFVEKLVEMDFPAISPSKDHRPLVINGHYLTCWHKEKDLREHVNLEDFAKLLKKFHEIAALIPNELPFHNPFDKIELKLQNIIDEEILDQSDIEFFAAQKEILKNDYKDYNESLTTSVVHADAHLDNVIVTDSGLVLCDFDDISYGPLEWDLVMTATAVVRFNVDIEKFKKFSAIYGYDILADKNADILIRVRELSMVLWLCQNKGQSHAIDHEIAHRIKTMRDNDRYALWTIF